MFFKFNMLHVVSPLEGVAHSRHLFRDSTLADRLLQRDLLGWCGVPATKLTFLIERALILEGLGEQSGNQGMATGIDNGIGLWCQVKT